MRQAELREAVEQLVALAKNARGDVTAIAHATTHRGEEWLLKTYEAICEHESAVRGALPPDIRESLLLCSLGTAAAKTLLADFASARKMVKATTKKTKGK
jgi:hypothetical protein